jgi:FkbM family methyltransferase
MKAVTGLIKPCYLFAPRALARRIGLMFSEAHDSRALVQLPWGSRIEVNTREGIGRELFRQNLFDIAVSETAWRLLRPGDRAVDVGANIGYMTSLFAMRTGPSGTVDSFEPHPRILKRLERNVASIASDPAAARITVHRCALGSHAGTARLLEPSIFGLNEGAATVARRPVELEPSGAADAYDVDIARLDAILDAQRIALLKVDVEGFEPQVLAGAERLLAACTIEHIIYEAHECEQSEVHRILNGYGYSIFGLGHTLFGPRITAGSRAPRVDRSWESPSYLATLSPRNVQAALRGRGWRILSSVLRGACAASAEAAA